MAQRTWYRMRLKRPPVAGCCFLLALSVVALTSFSPASLNSYNEPDFQYLARDEPLEKAAHSKRVWTNSTVSVARQAWRFSHRIWPCPQGRPGLLNPSSACKQNKLSSQGGQDRQGLKARRKYSRRIRKHNIGTKSPEPNRKPHAKDYPSRTSLNKRRKYDAPFTLRKAGKDLSFSPHTVGKEVGWKPQRRLAPLAPHLQDGKLGAHLFRKNALAGQQTIPQEQCKPHVQTANAERQPSDLIKAFISDKPSSQSVTGTRRQMGNAHSRHLHVWASDPEGLQKSDWCKEPRGSGRPGKPEGRLRFGEKSLPWFTLEDVQKMKLLANGTVVNKDRIPGHGQILRVALSFNQGALSHDPNSLCSDGLCGLIKRTTDLYEVLAFHLDRVLGLHRSLPAVARKFSSHLLPYKYTNGAPRPIVWWAPDIQHLNDSGNDQNSFALSWQQYQELLGRRCGMEDSRTSLGKAPCLTVLHSEWAKLALFDFLLQVHDRLDRYCCGFQPDPSEPCIQEMLHEKCRSPTELPLVHILIRRTKPSHLVFIDNAGRPLHPEAKLNFRLLQGIDGFPETALTVLKSGCLQNLLLQSLYVDEEFWESQGGYEGLQYWLHTIDRRGQILLQYIQKCNLTVLEDSLL